MEYLTLHDMPQRHMYNARRMATPDEIRGSDRTLPALPTVRLSPSPCGPAFPFTRFLLSSGRLVDVSSAPAVRMLHLPHTAWLPFPPPPLSEEIRPASLSTHG